MSDEDTPTGFEFEATPTDPEGAIPKAVPDAVTAVHALPTMLEQARKSGYERASADVVQQVMQAREEAIEATRQLFLMFELPFPKWEDAERWIRSRLTPI